MWITTEPMPRVSSLGVRDSGATLTRGTRGVAASIFYTYFPRRYPYIINNLNYKKGFADMRQFLHTNHFVWSQDVTTFWTQITYRFNGWTTQPLKPCSALGRDDPTSHFYRQHGATRVGYLFMLADPVRGSLSLAYGPSPRPRFRLRKRGFLCNKIFYNKAHYKKNPSNYLVV